MRSQMVFLNLPCNFEDYWFLLPTTLHLTLSACFSYPLPTLHTHKKNPSPTSTLCKKISSDPKRAEPKEDFGTKLKEILDGAWNF